MKRRTELQADERQRIIERVGGGGSSAPGRPLDTANPIEMLADGQPEQDRDWVYGPDERYRIIQLLLIADGSPWMARLGFLLAASVVIAALGLANNQPAAVIAAMVVAPMMTPVLGIAASVVLGLGRQAARLTVIVVIASVISVGVSWIIARLLVVNEVTAEELSRTTPRLRDLVIALAAGAAGMYSIARKDLSGVVPGVAIAVALVPPLATVGIVLERNEWALARGAALLYGVNVIAIVVAAIVVLLVTDFIDSPSVAEPRVVAGAMVIAVAATAIVIPLVANSRRIDAEIEFRNHAREVTAQWDRDHPAHHVVSQEIELARVVLVISGPVEPPSLDRLRADLPTDRYPDPQTSFVWVPSQDLEP